MKVEPGTAPEIISALRLGLTLGKGYCDLAAIHDCDTKNAKIAMERIDAALTLALGEQS